MRCTRCKDGMLEWGKRRISTVVDGSGPRNSEVESMMNVMTCKSCDLLAVDSSYFDSFISTHLMRFVETYKEFNNK